MEVSPSVVVSPSANAEGLNRLSDTTSAIQAARNFFALCILHAFPFFFPEVDLDWFPSDFGLCDHTKV